MGLLNNLVFTLALAAAAGAQENVGVSRADLPNYSGAFSIENNTGITLHYQVRWGNQHAWKSITLGSGQMETHSYPLGEDPHARVPTPYIRYDRVGGDNQFTGQEYKIQFYAVGYAGFGPNRNTTRPKAYYFQFAPDHRSLNLFAR